MSLFPDWSIRVVLPRPCLVWKPITIMSGREPCMLKGGMDGKNTLIPESFRTPRANPFGLLWREFHSVHACRRIAGYLGELWHMFSPVPMLSHLRVLRLW